MENTDELRRAFRLSVIICAAILATLILYAVIIEILKYELKPMRGLLPAPALVTFRYIFYAAAIVVILLIRFFARSLLKRAKEDALRQAIQNLSRAAVITCLLGELPALLGFVLFLFSGSSRDFYPLLFVSFFLEFMYFPRIRNWEEILKEQFPAMKSGMQQ